MKNILFLLILTFAFSLSVFAQKKHKFSGVIKTQNSEVIAGANLYFMKDGKRKIVTTDINGEFDTELTPGDYEITLNDVVSKTFKAYIKIQENGVNPNNVVFAVKLNKNPCGLDENESCLKPTSLPKPPYPATARVANIEGEVIVKMKVDSTGKVTSVNAINGHPLLRKAAEIGAKKAKFVQNEKESGREFYMTYVFLADKDEKPNLNKYKSLYRVEMLNNLVLIDSINYNAL